jgi:hypothetical protein
MKKTFFAVTVLLLFLSEVPFADDSKDWSAAAGSPDILYRWQEFDNSYACFIEYRDQLQGPGYTSFDSAVDYRSTDLDQNNRPKPKTDNEHITTAPNRTASARIPNCVGVMQATVSLVQRQ